VKRLSLFRRMSAIVLTWADWAADLLARFGYRSDATPLPLTFFAASRRSQPGATLIQRLNHLHHNWLSPTIQVHLSAISPDTADEKRPLTLFRPELQQVVRMPARTEPMQRCQVHLQHYTRQLDRSVSRMTLIDLARRERFNRAPHPAGQLNDFARADPAPRLAARHIAPIANQQMALAEAPRAALRRATRVSELPPSTLRVEMRRPERAIGPVREPHQPREVSVWHQSPGGIVRASEPALPPIGVEQLAGQVLKEIDRRVMARRERLGQR
jgi:hypothetical protein